MRSSGIHSSVMFIWILKKIDPKVEFEIYILEIIFISLKGQWVNFSISTVPADGLEPLVMITRLGSPTDWKTSTWKPDTLDNTLKSLTPGRYGCNPELIISGVISRIDIFSISHEITLRWMQQSPINDEFLEAMWRIYALPTFAIIGSDNGLSPVQRQAIIWTNAVLWPIGPLGANFSQIEFEVQIFSFKKMPFKMSSG